MYLIYVHPLPSYYSTLFGCKTTIWSVQNKSDGVPITVKWRSDQSQPAIFWNPWSNKSGWWLSEGDNPWNLKFSSWMNLDLLCIFQLLTSVITVLKFQLPYYADIGWKIRRRSEFRRSTSMCDGMTGWEKEVRCSLFSSLETRWSRLKGYFYKLLTYDDMRETGCLKKLTHQQFYSWEFRISGKAKLLQLNRTQFSSLEIFISTKVGNRKTKTTFIISVS